LYTYIFVYEINYLCEKRGENSSSFSRRNYFKIFSGPAEPLNINHYATKKSVAESMLDVALLMANASQLKAVLEQGPEFKYYLTVIVLIATSLFFQVLAGALFVHMARKNLNDVANQRKLDIINNVATVLVFLTVIINIFITAFGVQKTGLYPKQ
uniref:Ninjurin 2 n=1 Tax=Sinocyclocheilus rhinocerous TaxID=307959 RepID=A0A673K4C1_9TELE